MKRDDNTNTHSGQGWYVKEKRGFIGKVMFGRTGTARKAKGFKKTENAGTGGVKRYC